MAIKIRKYEASDEKVLFDLIEGEGSDWSEYCVSPGRKRYRRAIEKSETFLLFDNDVLCGYIRPKNDDGFGVYVYDLLVSKSHRGRQYGRMLLEHVFDLYQGSKAYVMSDVDEYYQKLGYERIGSIYEIKKR